MLELDEYIWILLKYLGFYVGFTLVLVVFALVYVPRFRNITFPTIYYILASTYMKNVWKEKVAMLAELADVQSADEKLRSQGVIRVLEIGAGPGNNFQFYPDNIRLTLLEPNEFFMKTLDENRSKYPNIRVERVIVGVGENMAQVEDNSFDAVVATFVLCSVRDVNAVLKEIHRVLAPGGRYLFMEHGHGKREWLRWKSQLLINPLWKVISDGCQITKDTLVDIKSSELFINVHSKSFPPPTQASLFLQYIGGLNFYGSAQIANDGSAQKANDG